MGEFDSRKTSAQRLAETLKRCGFATSVTEAHRMAGEISNTEKKVQNYFDKKKNEIKDEMIKKIHGHREEFQNPPKDIVSRKINDYKSENFKEMVERAKNPETIQVQVYYDTPSQKAQVEKQEEKTAEKVPKVIVITDEQNEVLASEKPLTQLYENHTDEKKDYIDQYIVIEEEKISEAAFVEKAEEAPAEEKEAEPAKTAEVKAVKDEPMQKEAPKPVLQQRQQQSSMPMGPHPKTGNAQGVDIHHFFNFAKKGKI